MQHDISPDSDGTDARALDPGMALLRGQYVIERYLVRGGFGITYLARDSLERQVVIKECFPGAICCRLGDGVQARSDALAAQFASILRHFLREARRLARLSHPNIVGVHQVFEENGTAYMALDHVAGEDLLSLLEDAPHRLDPATIRRIMDTALDALRYIHDQKILHRDISPDNFLMGPDGRLTLIDFGAAREQAGRESRALSALLAVKDGYSPHEFYLTDVSQDPSGDLYSLGATFYHLITGDAPPDSQQRLAAVAAGGDDPYAPLAGRVAGFTRGFLSLIDQALEVLPRDRMQSAQAWLDGLHGTVRRDPDPVMRPLGPELRSVISRLVEDTNRELKPGRPASAARGLGASGRMAQTCHPLQAAPSSAKPSQPVDLFGTPIEDVDAWLRDQDRMAQARLGGARGPCAPHDPAPDSPQSHAQPPTNAKTTTRPPPPNTFLTRRFGRLRLSRTPTARNQREPI